MSLDVSAPASVEVKQTTTATVNTDKTRIKRVLFDFDLTTATAEVAFGTGDPFVQQTQEMWILSGAYYVNSISGAPQGSTAAEVLLTAVGTVVATIQATPGLKDQLIASGELIVSEGGLYELMK